MAEAVYQWKQPAPKLPGVTGTTSPMDPMGAPKPTQSPTFAPSGGGMSGGPSFGDLVKAGPAGSSPTPSFNDLFAGMGDQRAQNVQAAQQNVAQGFQPQAPSIASQQARNQFQKAQDETQRQVMEQAALAGRGETGQIVGDNRAFLTQFAMPQTMDFEASLAAQEEDRARTRSRDAMGDLLNLESLGAQERATNAQNSLAARGQDITMRGQNLQSQQAAAQLAENARQFNSRQEFEAWATREGWSQEAINRAWQSGESAAERGSRERLGFADLLSQETRQGRDIASRERMGLAEIASREKLGLADLSIREKALAQEGSQFTDRLSFDRYALERGYSEAEIERAWKSMESSKEIASQEKVAFAGLDLERDKFSAADQNAKQGLSLEANAQAMTRLGMDREEAYRYASLAQAKGLADRGFTLEESQQALTAQGMKAEDARYYAGLAHQERESAKDRSLTASEGALGRELDRYIADAGFDIDREQLAETVRQFDGKIAFDTWATRAGLDDNEKGRIWQGHLQDLNQKWSTGERLGSQEHQVLIEDKRVQAATAAQEFERVANLEVLGKTQEWEQTKIGILEGYQQRRDAGQMSHEQAMQAMQAETETKLTQMGIDATTARQAADIQARQWEVTRELKQQETLANAELLYKYASLRETTGIQKQELNLRAQEMAQDAAQFLQTFGLEEKRTLAMLESQEMKDLIGVNTMLMEMAGDDPDLIDLASEKFIKSLGMMKMGDNPMLSPQEVDGMIQALKSPPAAVKDDSLAGSVPKSGIEGVDGFVEAHLEPMDQLSKGNWLTAGQKSFEQTIALPGKVLKSIGSLFD